MADVNNSAGVSTSAPPRSYIPRPSRLPVPAPSIRKSPSRDALRAPAKTAPASLLRPKPSRDHLASQRTTAPIRDRDLFNGSVVEKALPLRSKPSNEVFNKPLGRPLSQYQEPDHLFATQTENNSENDPITQDDEKPKSARPSLSERAQDTLAHIPSSPALTRRRSAFFNQESPMRAPSRSASGSRPGSSYAQDETMRPPSRLTTSRPGSSKGYNGQSVPIDFEASTNTLKPSALHTPLKRSSIANTLKTPKSISNLRLAASPSKLPPSGFSNISATPFKSPTTTPSLKSGSKTIGRAVRPRASVNALFDDLQPTEPSTAATPSKAVGRGLRPRPSIGGLFTDPSVPETRPVEIKTTLKTVRPRSSIVGLKSTSTSEISKPLASPRGNFGMKKVSPTFSNASSSTTASHTSKESISTAESTTSKETTPKKSSTALREQIAKAKAAKRAALAKQVAIPNATDQAEEAPVIPSGTFDFGLEDPFNQNIMQDAGKGLLRKRIDAARTDGRLNIAAMGFKEIPTEVMSMYNLENINGSWAECVDLTRFVAADNELETIGDDIFPDTDPRDSTDDDEQGNQFGGLQTLDLHGNTLISIPRGLRRLELLTTLNLSNNKLGNDCFEVISQISSLRDLKIANNALSGELSASILSLSNLEVLDVHNNQLTSLPDRLVDLARLRVLNLSENTFTSLPFNALQQLPLTEFSAANNKLCGTLIQSVNAEFPHLRTLDISGNALKALSSGSLSLPSLHLLKVSANRLTHLPDVSAWTSLLTLSAADNSISALPEGFVGLPVLKTADLQGNDLRMIDDKIALMGSLDALLIGGNPLREKKFSGMNTEDLKRLLRARIEPDEPERQPEIVPQVLYIGSGDESDTGTEYLDAPSTPTLPRSPSASEWSINSTLGILDRSYSQSYSLNPLVAAQIASEHNISLIELHHNSFTEIPASIAFFGHTLTSLNLSHNALTSDTFVKDAIELPSLKALNLSSNTFLSLAPLLRHLAAPRLETLDVSFNRLVTLPPGLRDAFPALTTLLASNNTIREVQAEHVRGLKVLDLGSNELERLDARLGLVTSLQRLEVAGNRFRVPKYTVLERGTEALMAWLRDRVPAGEVEEVE